MSFVHLHTHTAYSLLDGSNKIENYVRKVKDSGMNAAAITDHGVMYGVIEFYKACRKEGIRPVIGCEIYVAPKSRFDRDRSVDNYYHLILLAENDQGYSNLVKIVSVGFEDGFYIKPRVDFETLEKYHEGLIALSACLAGQVPKLILRGDYEGAKKLAQKYSACFGKDHYYLELQDHGLPEQAEVNRALLRMHDETGIGLVATNDCHYTNAEDAQAHDVLLCIQTKKKVTDTDRMRYEGGQFYVKTEEEMRQLFSYIPEALDNTQKIADRCSVTIEFGKTKIPDFPVPEGYDTAGYLRHLCEEGLVRRYGQQADQFRDRLEYELSVIGKMGYVEYFLIVWDYINYARSQGIPVGPGRGSAAGSLVSYCIGITDIDPMRYDLIFERFLNPERVSMPDIDVDFCYERRGEVIDYVTRKYGADRVSQIVTFGTMAAKNAIRDVGRALDMPYSFVDSVAKQIPNRIPDVSTVTIDQSLKVNPELRTMYETDDQVRLLIDTARPLEGLPRHASMHAAGVIISAVPLDQYVPLARVVSGGPLVTQFEKTTVEEVGLLKMDFLGLRTLTVIHDALELVEKNHGIQADIYNQNFDDAAAYETIASGHTEGIFQLESAGMRSFMKELKPKNIEDIIAGISLYRPGPMDFIPRYLAGRRDPEHIHYDCPQLEPILKTTFGCMVYQEQVMQIVRDLAGYSMGRSDIVRRAMSKKKTDVMEKERRNFVYGNPDENVPGCIGNGISAEVANHIYDEMIDFGKYAFNKSHAAGYAVIAYQTAYLRTHYPAEFFAAMMTSVLDNTDKITEYIQVIRGLDIPLLPPDVNSGSGRFSVDDGAIRYGLYAIKSVGRPVIDAIVAEREKNGPFSTLTDFLERVHGRDINKRSVENLIKAGALDSLEGNRRQKMQVYPLIMDDVTNRGKNAISGQISFFDMADPSVRSQMEIALPDVEEFDKPTMLAFEKEVIGIYVSGHPLDDDRLLIKKNVTAFSRNFSAGEDPAVSGEDPAASGEDPAENAPADETSGLSDGDSAVIGGIIAEKKMHFTKKNQSMAFLTIEDLYGTLEVLVFPSAYEKYREILTEDTKVLISGHVTVDNTGEAKLIADDIVRFEDVPKELWISFLDRADYEEKKDALLQILSGREGTDTVILYLKQEKQINRLGPDCCVSLCPELIRALKEAFGQDKIVVTAGRKTFPKTWRKRT